MVAAKSKQITIIALEDEMLSSLYKDLLGSIGFKVIGATHGSELLAQVRSQRPDLIISGLNIIEDYLPAYRWALQNAFDVNGVPMLFITAASGGRVQREIPKSPRVRVLSKPCGLGLLERIVKELVDRGSS